MKIIHLVPSMESGGVEQVVLELGRELTIRGIDNLVISNGGRLVAQLEQDGVRHKAMPIGKKSIKTLFQISKLAHVLEQEQPDILHIHSRVPGWIGLLAANKLPESIRPAIVTTVHGLYSVSFYSAIMTKGERVIAVSECVKDYITSNYPKTPEPSIRVIPNSIDPSLYNQQYKPPEEWINDWQTDFPELQGKYTLCLPGRLTRIKGHLDLIPILKYLLQQKIPAHAVIVGEASKSKQAYKREIQAKFTEAGLSKHITWTGHRSDLINILSASDVVLSLSSKPESFGKTTLESLALGKPVLGYAHGGVKEQLENIFPDGMVALGDTKEAGEKLEAWYHSRPIIPEAIPQEYTLKGMIDAHINIYRELAEKHDR